MLKDFVKAVEPDEDALKAELKQAQEKLFGILGEDTYLAILDKVRLLGDLLGWPIDFVRALLP